MDEREWFTRLDSTAENPPELFEHFERRSSAGYTYHVLPDARHGVERGTVLVEGRDAGGDTDVDPDAGIGSGAVVRGYPSVPRVFALDPGVTSFFGESETVAVEEKLDGFNVRIADVGEPLAFTRSGHVCPYTTGRARALLDLPTFFTDHPRMTLCAELVGPETPYTTHDYEGVDSHAFRVFGVRNRESGEPLPVAERRDLCSAYDLPQPRFFGRYEPSTAVEGVREAVADLDAAGREGVVMRSADATSMLKYTTGSQHRDELAYGFSLPFDRGRDFLFSRVVREAFQAAEFEESEARLRERARDLGESILLPAVETIREVEREVTVGERHTVRGRAEEVDALLAHLRDQSLTLEIESDRREDGERVVEFVKVAESTRDRIRYYLEGGTYDE
jgi:putative ATP-dependent DNA ligase